MSAAPTQDFPLCPKLPTEIRPLIWELCLPGTRLLKPIKVSKRTAPHPATLHVCSESRKVALKSYELVGKSYFDFLRDLFMVDECLPIILMWGLSTIHKIYGKRIKYLWRYGRQDETSPYLYLIVPPPLLDKDEIHIVFLSAEFRDFDLAQNKRDKISSVKLKPIVGENDLANLQSDLQWFFSKERGNEPDLPPVSYHELELELVDQSIQTGVTVP